MSDPATESPRERVFTPALLVFVVAVVGVLGFAAVQRWSTPTLGQAVRALADGDLDGPDRPRVLRAVVTAAEANSDPDAAWAGLLAAVALADRPAYERARARIQVAPVETRFLDLGDPLLGNLSAAIAAELAEEPAEARRRWAQVEAQCRLAPRPLAAALAAEAIARLPR